MTASRAEKEKIRMLITGNWNRPPSKQHILRDIRGFTLIELTMVILLAGLLLSLTIPRFRDAVLSDNLKGTTRKLIVKIDELRDASLRNHKDYVLQFDLEANRYWVEDSGMSELERAAAREQPSTFPEDVRILDIWFLGAGKQATGEASIWFYRKGYVRPSLIHLSSGDGRKFTLELRPFMRKVKVTEGYVEFENM